MRISGKIKELLSYMAFVVIVGLASCCVDDSTVDKSISDPKEYSDLCEFDGAILVQLVYNSELNNYVECMHNGVARKEKVNPVLYRYLDENVEPGTIIRCDSTRSERAIIKNLIPPLEKTK